MNGEPALAQLYLNQRHTVYDTFGLVGTCQHSCLAAAACPAPIQRLDLIILPEPPSAQRGEVGR